MQNRKLLLHLKEKTWRRNYHETFHESMWVAVQKNSKALILLYISGTKPNFFSSLLSHRAAPLLVNTHMTNNINMQLIGFKKNTLKKSIDAYNSISYDEIAFNCQLKVKDTNDKALPTQKIHVCSCPNSSSFNWCRLRQSQSRCFSRDWGQLGLSQIRSYTSFLFRFCG